MSRVTFAFAVLAVALVALGINLWVIVENNSKRIDRVETQVRVELCSTHVSCEHLLSKLLKNITPVQRRELTRIVLAERRAESVPRQPRVEVLPGGASPLPKLPEPPNVKTPGTPSPPEL